MNLHKKACLLCQLVSHVFTDSDPYFWVDISKCEHPFEAEGDADHLLIKGSSLNVRQVVLDFI